MTSKIERLLILDFGSQYTHLILKSIRKLKVFCDGGGAARNYKCTDEE